jgi:hypothetical protein
MADATQARTGAVGQFAVGQHTPANTIMWFIVPNSELKFVGTTAYIDLIENQRAQMSFATKMRIKVIV